MGGGLLSSGGCGRKRVYLSNLLIGRQYRLPRPWTGTVALQGRLMWPVVGVGQTVFTVHLSRVIVTDAQAWTKKEEEINRVLKSEDNILQR